MQTGARCWFPAASLQIEAVRHRLIHAAGFAGSGRIFSLGLVAIDIALWDLAAKAVNLSLGTLVDGSRERVPAYASGALGRDLSLAVLVSASAQPIRTRFGCTGADVRDCRRR